MGGGCGGGRRGDDTRQPCFRSERGALDGTRATGLSAWPSSSEFAALSVGFDDKRRVLLVALFCLRATYAEDLEFARGHQGTRAGSYRHTSPAVFCPLARQGRGLTAPLTLTAGQGVGPIASVARQWAVLFGGRITQREGPVSKTFGIVIGTLAVVGLAVWEESRHTSIPDSGGVIHGCYGKSNGQLHASSTKARRARTTKPRLSWNEQGQQGLPGQDGEDGQPGGTGPAGPSGISHAYHLSSDGGSLDTDGNSRRRFDLPAGHSVVFAKATICLTGAFIPLLCISSHSQPPRWWTGVSPSVPSTAPSLRLSDGVGGAPGTTQRGVFAVWVWERRSAEQRCEQCPGGCDCG